MPIPSLLFQSYMYIGMCGSKGGGTLGPKFSPQAIGDARFIFSQPVVVRYADIICRLEKKLRMEILFINESTSWLHLNNCFTSGHLK